MLVGIISDTHGHVRNTLDAVERLEQSNVEIVIHCGDVGSASIVKMLAPWPTHFVRGNVDHEVAELQAAIAEAKQTFHDRFGSLELAGKRVAFLHGDDSRRWHTAVNDEQWDLLCYGHTHKAELRRIGATLVLNPGAVFRANPKSIAIVDLPSLSVEFLKW